MLSQRCSNFERIKLNQSHFCKTCQLMISLRLVLWPPKFVCAALVCRMFSGMWRCLQVSRTWQIRARAELVTTRHGWWLVAGMQNAGPGVNSTHGLAAGQPGAGLIESPHHHHPRSGVPESVCQRSKYVKPATGWPLLLARRNIVNSWTD